MVNDATKTPDWHTGLQLSRSDEPRPEPDGLPPSDPRKPELDVGATEQLEPEAAEEDAELAPPGSNTRTPLSSEQEQHLALAAKALDRLKKGFEDRHLPIVRGLRAARQAAWQAAWGAGDAQHRASLKLPSGLPNYHADAYRQRFREVLLRFFGDYWYATEEEQPVRNNRRAALSAYLSIGENLEAPADPKHGNKPGFLQWYRGLQESRRIESPKRLWTAYCSDVLGIREPKLDNRSERDRERHELEKRIVGLQNENTALRSEAQKHDEQIAKMKTATTTEEGLAEAAIALGPEGARKVMDLIAAWLTAKAVA
jgi:hypothetical protein